MQCRKCNAPIRVVKTLMNESLRLDAEPDNDAGTVVVIEGHKGKVGVILGRVNQAARASAVRNGIPLYVAHRTTCSAAPVASRQA